MKRFILGIGLLLLALLTAACGGLAGEPEIIGQMPTSNPQNAELGIPAIEADLALGAQVFAENCVRCHGATGGGDGEFVLSGQITEIPIFADPAQHIGRTAGEYYTTITQGRLDKLMPPFGDSLSEAQRWSVANYIFTLAGATAPVADGTESSTVSTVPLPESTESSTELNTNNPEATASSPETTPEALSSVLGTISGQLIQGTAGGSIPVGTTVNLQVVDMLGAESTQTAEVNADGTYQFLDVLIAETSAYRVSIEYLGGTFSSEFVVGTPATANMILDTTIYETTDDASVLQISVVLTQIDLIGENTLQVWQMINVTNHSDKLYIYPNANGRSVSVRVPVPVGFELAPSNNLERFAFDGTSQFIYDTRPVVPFAEHNFHLIYTVPFTNSFTVNQAFDYEFLGPYEVYVDSSILNLSANGWQELGNQEVNGINYRGIGLIDGSATGQTLTYTISRSGFSLDRNLIGYGLMALGLVFILGATLAYWRGRNQTVASPSTTPDEPSAALLKAIAELDERFEAKQISKKAYEKQRNTLKAQLVALMKEAK